MNFELEHAIASLEATYIKELKIDLFTNTIFVSTLTQYDDQQNPVNHEVTFRQVSAVYFSNGPENRRFNVKALDLIEISDVEYHNPPKNHITCVHDKPGIPHYNSDPNFRLELWSAALLIEAEEVVVDGILYQAA